MGISGAHLRAPHLPPPAAGARIHYGGSPSLQTLGGSCKQRQTELRGWVRMSFSIFPAALGAPAKGTADTRCDPTLSCWGEGRFLPPPVPGIPSTPRSWGCNAVQSTAMALKEPRAQPPTPAWHRDKPCRGWGSGSSPALSSQAGLQGRGQHCRCCKALPPAQPSPAREVEEAVEGAQPSIPLHRANGVGGVLLPPGQGSAGLGPPKQQAWSCSSAVPTELSYVTQPAWQLAL